MTKFRLFQKKRTKISFKRESETLLISIELIEEIFRYFIGKVLDSNNIYITLDKEISFIT